MLWVWELSQLSVALSLATPSAEEWHAPWLNNVPEEACMPFQYALSTRAGTDCVARVVRSMMELVPTKTLLSIDGIGAFDHITRESMLVPSTTMLIWPLSFLSSGCSTARIPRMCGTTTRECRMRSCREREVSRETPSCQRCMPWASTQH